MSKNSEPPFTNIGKDPSVVALAGLLLNGVMDGDAATAPTAEKLACIPRATEALVTAAQSEGSAHGMRGRIPKLTRRQMEVLELIVDGKCPREIGEELCISLRTVRNHIVAICRALGTRTYQEAAEKMRRSRPHVMHGNTEPVREQREERWLASH